MSNTYKTLLQAGLEGQSIELSNKQIDQLLAYLDLLEKWNKVYNLTSITDKQQMVILHLLDSLSILKEIKTLLNKMETLAVAPNENMKIVDVGTGGGLPGIPLSICLPQIKFTLIDARNKKISFLHQVVNELKLDNVKPVHSRAENYQADQKFELVITRAFSSIKDMLGICSHLCHTNGLFLAMKGKEPMTEINEIPEQYKLLSMKALDVYHLEASRHLLVLQKSATK